MPPKKRWLQNAKAAKLLYVDERTIKRWMNDPPKREALGAVRHGKQWRIPLPKSFDGDSEGAWEMKTRYRFKEMGVPLKHDWEKELEALSEQFARNALETYRLWLAAHLALSAKPDPITQEDILAITILWQNACEVLATLPRGTKVDKFKSQIPGRLKARNHSDETVHLVMSYWPDQRFFEVVNKAHTLEQLENIRQGMDAAQAAMTCKHLNQKPTAEYLRHYLHKNLVEHINDTRDALPQGFAVINSPTPEQMERLTYMSVCAQMQGKPPPPVIMDFRHPQNGLPLRTFRSRHPRRNARQTEIIKAIYRVEDNIPGADGRPHTGTTPIRGSKLSESSG